MRFPFPSLIISALLLAALPAAAQAEGDGDDLVRLPGQGLVKPDGLPPQLKYARLVPGGGLIASFDNNEDGRISPQELSDGIRAAFENADANGDGQLVALEQIDWADSLPTRDDTLANPVRFDPNLDRVVTFEEFAAVINQLAGNYQGGDGIIEIARLSAPEPKADRGDRRFPGGPPQQGGSRLKSR